MNKDSYPASENPFTLKFGSIPPLYIEPEKVIDDIMARLTSRYVTDNCMILTGVRGCGKTVTMTDIISRTRKLEEFYVVRIPSTDDILIKVVGQLYDTNDFIKEFIKKSFDLSKFGIGVAIEEKEPVSDIYVSMIKIMEAIKNKGKRLLIAIDEVSKTKGMEEFGKQFNALSSEGYPIYLIMTGLPENVTLLEDANDLTFLRRAYKKALEPLNLTLVRKTYSDTFHIGMEEAHKLASLTKGYATAYEVLGQVLWNHQQTNATEDVLKEYDELLEVKVYASIWKSLSDKEKMYLRCMAERDEMTTAEILTFARKSSNEFSQYRMRLARKGLIDISEFGKVRLTLPRFDRFIKNMILMEEIS